MSEPSFPRHAESTALVQAPVAQAFAFLDDPLALAAHMGESSMMMLGSRMHTEVDAGGGRAVGSTIRMRGHVLGIQLSLDEVICERREPLQKCWQTVGSPQLVVIGSYRMGFELSPQGDNALLRVWIDYGWPKSALSYCLGRLLGGSYARWCTQRMAQDAAEHFKKNSHRTLAR